MNRWCFPGALCLLLVLSDCLFSTGVSAQSIEMTRSFESTESRLLNLALQKVTAQQAKLVAEDGSSGDSFGYGVAIFGDTALVGAYSEDIGNNVDQGAVYVFLREGNQWTQQAKLVNPEGEAQDYFGISVALSGDTALVGAFGSDTGGNAAQGSAFIFTRTGGLWTLETALVALDATPQDLFGFSVALQDGTALVGAPGKTIGSSSNQGAAYVFTGSGSSWQEQSKLVAGDGMEADLLGSSVAIFSGTAIVGAYLGDDSGVQNQGSAYVFSNGSGAWVEQAKLVAADGAAGDQFGVSVALGRNTALVGASLADSPTNADQGSVFVFTRSGTTWMQHEKLSADQGTAFSQFGVSVAISGSHALIGAPGDNGNKGAAYLYRRDSEGAWTHRDVLTATDGEKQDNFGISVAAQGDYVLVGAFSDQIAGVPLQGSTYVFDGLNDLFADGFE